MTSQKLDTIEKINKSAIKFLSPLDTYSTYKTIVEEAIKLISGTDGIIILRDGRSFKRVYTSSLSIEKVPIRKKGFIYTSLTKNRAFVINAKDIHSAHPEVLDQGIKSSVLIPLTHDKKTIGVLMVRFKRDEKFDTEQLKVLKLFGSMASLAIQKTQLFAETRKAVETRDLFIALASHELKTPLTSITIYSQLLLKKLQEEKHIKKEWAEKLFLESSRLALLVDELLAVNQMKTGHLRYEWATFPLYNVVQRAIGNTAIMYPTAHIIFQTKFKPKQTIIFGDFNKLMQVIINILNNAAKFTSNDKTIIVTLSNQKNKYHITVTDEGKGIPKDDLEKIFDRFYKGSSNFEEGMGLGLFLTKKIIEDHKGKITIASEIGRGTMVTVELPKK